MSVNLLLDRAYDIVNEVKSVRHVRTPAGVRRFNQPIGSIIVRDRKLRNLTGLESVYEGWDRAKGSDGKEYSVGYDDETEKWIATAGDDDWDAVVEADSEDEVWDALDSHAGGGKGKRSASGAKFKAGDRVYLPLYGGKQTGRVNKVNSDGTVEVYYRPKNARSNRAWTGDPSKLKPAAESKPSSGRQPVGGPPDSTKFDPGTLSVADLNWMKGRTGLLGALDSDVYEKFRNNQATQGENIKVVDAMLRRYRAVTAAATRQQPQNASAAKRLKNILDRWGVDVDKIVSNRKTTYTDEARAIVTGKPTSRKLDLIERATKVADS